MNPKYTKRFTPAWSALRVALTVLAIALAVVVPAPAGPVLGFAVVAGAYSPEIIGPVPLVRQCRLAMGVDTTTFTDDFKSLYGSIQNQVSTEAIFLNLLDDGTKIGEVINTISVKGYTNLARLTPNWNMGYRKESSAGVGVAGNQGLKQYTVGLKYAYCPVLITGQAENLSQNNKAAFMQAKALETKFDTEDMCKHVNVVMMAGERGGRLATVSASGVGTFTCDNAGNLPGALYLRVGMPVDAGPTTGGALSITAQTILTINYTTRVVTHAAGTATIGHGIFLSKEAATAGADFPLTAECLQSLIDDTSAIQGLDPTVAGQTAWKSYIADGGAADISNPIMQELRQFVRGRSGKKINAYLFPMCQINQYGKIATTNTRFESGGGQSNSIGKRALDLGFTVFDFGGTPIIEEPDMRPDRIVAGDFSCMHKYEAIPLTMADDEAGSWTRVTDANGPADAITGLLRWYHQLGVDVRAAFGMYKNLSTTAKFTTQPTVL